MSDTRRFLSIGGIIVFLMLVALILSYVKNEKRVIPPGEDVPAGEELPSDSDVILNTYESDGFDFEFDYRISPRGYTLIEHPDPDDVARLSLVLIDSVAYQELLESENPREAPPAITLQVYEWGEYADPLSWIVQSERSNISGEPEESKEGGVTFYRYNTDGLYGGKSVAYHDPRDEYFSRYIYVWNVGYITADDDIVDDFANVIRTFRLGADRE